MFPWKTPASNCRYDRKIPASNWRENRGQSNYRYAGKSQQVTELMSQLLLTHRSSGTLVEYLIGNLNVEGLHPCAQMFFPYTAGKFWRLGKHGRSFFATGTVEKPAETQISIRLASHLVRDPNSRSGGHEFESPMRWELGALTKSEKTIGSFYTGDPDVIT
jgi:hypothetical protein